MPFLVLYASVFESK